MPRTSFPSTNASSSKETMLPTSKPQSFSPSDSLLEMSNLDKLYISMVFGEQNAEKYKEEKLITQLAVCKTLR